MMNGLQIRWLLCMDVKQVVDIARCDRPAGWDSDEFIARLARETVVCRVAEHNFLIHGFIVYEFHDDHIEIHSIGVAPDVRRQGIGMAMLENVRRGRDRTHRQWIKAMLPESNLRAQQFFRAAGFSVSEIVHGRFDGGEDGYLMCSDSAAAIAESPLVNRLAKTNQGKGQ